jgi:hypothetical protein
VTTGGVLVYNRLLMLVRRPSSSPTAYSIHFVVA